MKSTDTSFHNDSPVTDSNEAIYKPVNVFATVIDKPIPLNDDEFKFLKVLLETKALEISGLNNNFVSVQPQGTGNKPPLFSKYEPLNPTFIFDETNGRGVERFVYDKLVKSAGFSVLFFEPTSDYTGVQCAWLCDDMRVDRFESVPSARYVGRVDQHSSKCKLTFRCTTHRRPSVMHMAESVLGRFNAPAKNPYRKISFPA